MRFFVPFTLLIFGGLLWWSAVAVTEKSIPAQKETLIIFRSDRDGANAFYRMNLEGKQVTRLTNALPYFWQDRISSNGTSPDGEWFYFRTDTTLNAVHLNGEGERVVIQNYHQNYTGASGRYNAPCLHCGFQTWTPDGYWMIYNQQMPQGRTLFRMLSSGERREEIFDLSGYTMFITWSPDGQRLLVINSDAQQNFYTLLPNGRDRQRVYTSQFSANFFAWSKDNWLWFLDYDYNLDQRTWFRIRPDGRDYQLVENFIPQGRVLSISPDGAWVYYLPLRSASDIYRIPTDGLGTAAPTLVLSLNFDIYLGNPRDGLLWSQDGGGITFRHENENRYYRARADGSDLRALDQWESYRLNSQMATPVPLVSADGVWKVETRCCVVITSDNAATYTGYHEAWDWHEIISTNLVTGKTIALSPYPYNRLYGWSPDRTWILFLSIVGDPTEKGAWELFRVRPDGSDLQNLTTQAGDDEFVAILGPHPTFIYPEEGAWVRWLGSVLCGLGAGMLVANGFRSTRYSETAS